MQALAIPAAFVLLWSTGFIGAKYGLPYAEPFTMLAIRLAITALLLSGIALVLRASWPASAAEASHIALVGMLLHGAYLGGVFYAIELGMPTGITALIVGLQPILTAVLAQLALNEHVSSRQWIGLMLGFVGVALTVWGRTGNGETTLPALAVVSALIALLGITLATIYQKRFCTGMNLVSGTAIQYMAACLILTIGAFAFETRAVEWSLPFTLTMAWLILVLSVGAVMLLMTLIKRGSAARVTALFYLVPPITALMGFALFDEQLGLPAIAGMLIAVSGVFLATRARA